jgi:hypothetical protein
MQRATLTLEIRRARIFQISTRGFPQRISDAGDRFSTNFVDLEQLVQSNQNPIKSGGGGFMDQLSSRAEHNLKD